jgi:UDP-N-acetylglucosamine acyltransferase
MPTMPSPGIHPLAIISPEAELADDVSIGPCAVLEGRVRLGRGCVVYSEVYLCGPLSMGRANRVFPGAVLGEEPQDIKYKGEPTHLEIGDGNVFRERVTINRGTAVTGLTRIGSDNVFLAGSHVGHDCRIGNGCTLAEGALVGGHCSLGDGVHLACRSAVHQSRRVGRLAHLAAASITTKDMPPFVKQRGVNTVVGINSRGMRRAGISATEIDQVRRAFRILFYKGLALPVAILRIEEELGWSGAVGELTAFLRDCDQGINGVREHTVPSASGARTYTR